MSLLVILAGLLIVLPGGSLLLGLARRTSDWPSRRSLQFSVLLMPLVMLGLGFCALGLSFRHIFPGSMLVLAMGGLAFGALSLGMVRFVLMRRFVACQALFCSPEVQLLADGLSRQLGMSTPLIRLCPADRPLALTSGFQTPTILLSTWMVKNLDRRELEAVLAHELEHVARHDYLVVWLATMLRDAFFYLPTSWIAYRQLQHEKELACDDFTVGLTQRPLALASALTKVWLHAIDATGPARFGGAQPLADAGTSINGRIERLLAPSAPLQSGQHARRFAFSLNTAVLVLVTMFQIGCLFLLLFSARGGCHPAALCGRLY